MVDTEVGLSAEAAIRACRADLAAYQPAEEVLKRLLALEAQAGADRALRAQWLVAKGIATNRLGLRSEALGDLSEAADVCSSLNDGVGVADAKREAAVAHSWGGEGREAGLALLRAVAESLAAKDVTGAAMALIGAGRLELEMGRPRAAAPLFERTLKIDGANVPAIQRLRAGVNQLQALVAAGLIDEAQRLGSAIERDLATATPRLRLLVAIEESRCACAQGRFAQAHERAAAARALAPSRPECFEAVEIAELEAEIAMAERDFEQAETKAGAVVARFADDDLAGREVKARLLRAKALDGLGRPDDAERTLAAALRRAVARGLIGHADQVRTALAARGASEGAGPLDASLDASADLARRFVRRQPLGAGAQGSVSRAYDIELGVEVALKRVALAAVYDTEQRKRLIAAARTEIVAASRINHPGVARVRGLIVESDGDATLIEDLVDGPTLRSLMKGPLEAERALNLVARIAFALSAIHEARIVHCDLKPENVVLAGGANPVIIDFGIAMIDPRGRSGRGTARYMAPEQKRGGRVDARADLFALGVIALELLGVDPGAARDFWRNDIWSHDNAARTALRAAGVDARSIRRLRSLVAPVKWLRPRSAAEASRIIIEAAGQTSRQG